MKMRLVTLNDFKGHSHPASKLFRAIELKTVYEECKKMDFMEPSVDIGCGDGYMSSILFDKKFTYGVDNGEAKDVQIAIKKKLYKKVLIEGAEKMSLKNSSVNFVFSNSVIEHIPDNGAVLSETSRILKKNGVFVFTSPSYLFSQYLYISNILNRIGLAFIGNWYAYKRNKMLNHYHTYSHLEWTRRLARYGLKVIKYKYYISKNCLIFWDKLALEVRIKNLFDKKAEQNVYKKCQKQIQDFYKNDIVVNNKGASLFIFAVKK